MSSYDAIPASEFSPNEAQADLIAEFVERYGPLTGFLPDVVENTDPVYQDLFARMKSAGFGPSTLGWVPAGYFDPES